MKLLRPAQAKLHQVARPGQVLIPARRGIAHGLPGVLNEILTPGRSGGSWNGYHASSNWAGQDWQGQLRTDLLQFATHNTSNQTIVQFDIPDAAPLGQWIDLSFPGYATFRLDWVGASEHYDGFAPAGFGMHIFNNQGVELPHQWQYDYVNAPHAKVAKVMA